VRTLVEDGIAGLLEKTLDYEDGHKGGETEILQEHAIGTVGNYR